MLRETQMSTTSRVHRIWFQAPTGGVSTLEDLVARLCVSSPIALYYRYSELSYVFHVSQGIALSPAQRPSLSWDIARLCWKHADIIAAQAVVSLLSHYTIGFIAAILSQIAASNDT